MRISIFHMSYLEDSRRNEIISHKSTPLTKQIKDRTEQIVLNYMAMIELVFHG